MNKEIDTGFGVSFLISNIKNLEIKNKLSGNETIFSQKDSKLEL